MDRNDEVYKALEKWTKKLEEPQIAKEFEGFNKAMQFYFSDLNNSAMVLNFRNQSCSLFEGEKLDAEITLTTTSDVIIGITNGKIDPMEAFIAGQLQPKGQIQDLQKLEYLIK